ncbi:MAG: hypothetical protein LRS43_00175 [Desulfurococcales archaeon]|nr:hypothetical protein [Desulfurococcales archaeon]
MSLEERLDRLEGMLRQVVRRLEELEELLGGYRREAEATRVAARLALTGFYPVYVAVEAARRVIRIVESAGPLDPISRSIIESLSACEPLSVSDITRRVREIRGRASRRIVSERVKRLEDRGLVVRVGGRARPGYTLRECLGGSGGGGRGRG